jgi:hypothetical protein
MLDLDVVALACGFIGLGIRLSKQCVDAWIGVASAVAAFGWEAGSCEGVAEKSGSSLESIQRSIYIWNAPRVMSE